MLFRSFNNAGVVHLKLEEPRKAYGKFRRAASLKPDVPLYVHNQGLALWQAIDYEGAQQAYERAIKNDANYYDSHIALGELYY